MPLYEYECGACGHRFEVIQKFSDSPIERCPLCAEPVHKLLSAPAIQFKGTGWYVTDYASKRNTEAAADAKSASASTSGDNGKAPPSTGTSDTSKVPPSSGASDSSKTASSGESSSSKSTTASDSSAAKTDTKSGKSLPE